MMASEPQNESPFPSNLSPWMPLLVFTLLAFSIGAASSFIFERNKRYIEEAEIQNLGAIADLKAAQIAAWAEIQRRRAALFLHGSLLPDEFGLWLNSGARPGRQQRKILLFLAGVQKTHGYKNTSLLDVHGSVVISTDVGKRLDTEEKQLALAAMREKKVLFLDFHRGAAEPGHPIEISFAAPLVETDRQGNHVVGAVLLVIDPASFLYPMIRYWPTPSRSAETMLVRREGDDVLFLNELRHRKGTALSLRMPVATPNLASATWLRGQHDPMESVDYRGVPVVSAIRKVPDTPWVMVAKMDKDELLAPITMLQQWVTSLAIVLSAVGGILVIAWYRASHARFQRLRALHDAAVEREALVRHFDYLSRFGSDIVLLVDAQGRIVEPNHRAALAYGYSAKELKRMSIRDLLRPGVDLPLDEVEKTGGLRFESVHVRKDKSEFPVETSLHAITIEGKKYYQGIIRDITERRRVEADIEYRNTLLSTLTESSIDGSLVVDENGSILLFNQRLVDMWGIPSEVIATRSDELALKSVLDKLAEPQNFLDKVAHLYAHREETSQDEIELKDGRTFERYSAPMFGPGARYHGRVWSFHDITERKLAEDKLNESNRELQRLATHLEVVREEEQKRIARELHDGMGGALAALNMKVALLAADPPVKRAVLSAELDSLGKLVADGVQVMRQIVTELRPCLLGEVGLKSAIEKYTQEFCDATHIECDLRLPEEELNLDENLAATLFRIVQESLTNVAKHAEADKIGIVLSLWDGSLMLTVKDNGKGFDPQVRKPKSFGLIGIRERAAMMGGKAEITSEPGKGTTVRVRLPRAG